MPRNCLRLLPSADRAVPAAELARVVAGQTVADESDAALVQLPEMRDPGHMGDARVHKPLPGLQLYEQMQHTRVLFSFGSKYG
eukprot:SAG22_NODE_7981_length_693_cov_1.297980_2_plen_82_part_01